MGELTDWYRDSVNENFIKDRDEMCALLSEENNLMEIVKLIGSDVLPDDQKLIIEIARVIRVGFLQQNAFHKDDTYVPLEKQFDMMDIILYFYHRCQEVVARQVPISKLTATGMFDRLIKMKYDIPNDKPEMFAELRRDIDKQINTLLK